MWKNKRCLLGKSTFGRRDSIYFYFNFCLFFWFGYWKMSSDASLTACLYIFFRFLWSDTEKLFGWRALSCHVQKVLRTAYNLDVCIQIAEMFAKNIYLRNVWVTWFALGLSLIKLTRYFMLFSGTVKDLFVSTYHLTVIETAWHLSTTFNRVTFVMPANRCSE